jgi:hypothetical protein
VTEDDLCCLTGCTRALQRHQLLQQQSGLCHSRTTDNQHITLPSCTCLCGTITLALAVPEHMLRLGIQLLTGLCWRVLLLRCRLRLSSREVITSTHLTLYIELRPLPSAAEAELLHSGWDVSGGLAGVAGFELLQPMGPQRVMHLTNLTAS